eukprot:1160533-Pelagomonas_calceolata.AAC.16
MNTPVRVPRPLAVAAARCPGRTSWPLACAPKRQTVHAPPLQPLVLSHKPAHQHNTVANVACTPKHQVVCAPPPQPLALLCSISDEVGGTHIPPCLRISAPPLTLHSAHSTTS